MSDYTLDVQVDWSEVFGYFTPEDAAEFFSDASNELSL